MIESVTYLLAILTVVGQVLAVVLLFEIVRVWLQRGSSAVLSMEKQNALLFSFFVASVATLGSLFFSEIAQYEPCKFCWFQRILMYPLVILFGLALARGARDADLYGLVFGSLGVVVAAYHYLMQVGAVEPTSCSAVGFASSCADAFTMTFGYITIPMMAFTAFVLITLFTILARYHD